MCVVVVGDGSRHPCDAHVMCRHLHHWPQGRGVIDGVGAHGGVAVGQGRERGHGARTYTGTSLPPCPLSLSQPTVVVVLERG